VLERDRHHLAAARQHAAGPDDALDRPVAAFHQDLRPAGGDQRLRRVVLEPGQRVDALERGQPGAPVSWRNPDSGRYGTIVPGPQYQQAGRNCRSYTHTIYVGGQPQTARGTACRNPDGTWTAVG